MDNLTAIEAAISIPAHHWRCVPRTPCNPPHTHMVPPPFTLLPHLAPACHVAAACRDDASCGVHHRLIICGERDIRAWGEGVKGVRSAGRPASGPRSHVTSPARLPLAARSHLYCRAAGSGHRQHRLSSPARHRHKRQMFLEGLRGDYGGQAYRQAWWRPWPGHGHVYGRGPPPPHRLASAPPLHGAA